MNKSDETRALDQIQTLLTCMCPEAAVIAFESSRITDCVRNVKSRRMLDELNDLLSRRDVSERLGTVLTLCEFDGATWFLIRADRAMSVTPRFKAPDYRFWASKSAATDPLRAQAIDALNKEAERSASKRSGFSTNDLD